MSARVLSAVSSIFLLICWSELTWTQLHASDLGPGTHMVSCNENPAVRYRLIIPDTYDAQSPYGAPLFISMVTAEGSGTFGIEQWGAPYGVVTIGVYNDGTGNDGRDELEMHRMCVRDVSTKLNIHPHLRFTIGVSASAARGMVIAANDGDHYAGCIMQAHSGHIRGLAKHIAVAYAHGEKDQVHPISAAKSHAAALRQRGNPVYVYWHGGGHDGSDRANREEGRVAHQRMRTWMLWTGKLGHPQIGPEERRYYVEQLVEHIREQTTDKTIAEVDAVFEEIQIIEPALQIRDVLLAIAEAKVAALWRAYEASEDDIGRVCALVDILAEPMIQGHEKFKEAGRLLRELERSDRALQKEGQAWRQYASVRHHETNMEPGDQKALQACVAGYMNITRRDLDTRGGQAAAAAIERLRAAHEQTAP